MKSYNDHIEPFLCPGCGKEVDGEWQYCPYEEEINNELIECRCCPECVKECENEI